MSTAVFLRYVEAEMGRQGKERAYRAYVTDALRLLTENTARCAGGVYLRSRFTEEEGADRRGAKEIIADIRRKLRCL